MDEKSQQQRSGSWGTGNLDTQRVCKWLTLRGMAPTRANTYI